MLTTSKKIPHRYESPIFLRGIGIVYPDFTVLNVRLQKEFYWEHFGMMEHQEYAEYAIQRIGIYEKNGILPGNQLILTFETKRNPINQKTLWQTILRYFK